MLKVRHTHERSSETATWLGCSSVARAVAISRSDRLGREIFNATTVPAPRAGHATVTLNGEPLGLYVLLEGANKQFLKRHFQNVEGNYYEGAFRGDISPYLEAKSGAHPADHSDLDAL